MGALRLFLAIVVMFSHMGYTFYGYNLGVTAVVIFYLLAGQVVARLWYKAPVERRLWWFLRDRALRILPAYYISLALVAFLWWVGLLYDPHFLALSPATFEWFANISLIPMNYFMFNDSDRFALLPTAWSLAVEVQFYLLVPLLLSRRSLFRVCALVSLLIYAGAQLGFLQQDYYGYRLLPGVLWVFLSGALLAQPSRRHYAVLGVLWVACCIYTICLFYVSQPYKPHLMEVAVGYVLGVPLVHFLSRVSILSSGFQRFQRYAGACSYPLFLIHLPVIWLIHGLFGTVDAAWVWVLAVSLVYSVCLHRFIELPLWRWLRPALKL